MTSEKIFVKIKHVTFKILRMLIYPALLFTAMEIFYKMANRTQEKEPVVLSHLLGLLIFAAIYFLFAGILKSAFITNIVLSILFFVILVICQIKIAYSLNPVFLSDINFLNSPGTFTDIMSGNVFKIILKKLPYFFLLFALFSAICVLSRFKNIRISRACFRLTAVMASIIVLIFLFIPVKAKDDKLIDRFFKIDRSRNSHTTSNIKYYYMHSFIGGLYGEHILSRLNPPGNYSRKELSEILDKASKLTSDGEWGKPNIIMVFSESFWDMEHVNEIVFDRDITPNFKRLSGKGMSFDIISPAFGGISCNPEFMVLTGGTCSYFSQNYIPYINLYLNDNYFKAPSVISELKTGGYRTKIASAWSDSLFNSKNVYKYYGVDEVTFRKDLKEPVYKGKYISDDYVADCIIDRLKKKTDDKPLFYMFLTAEAHMPFYDKKFDKYDISVVSSEFNEETTGMLKSYAQGIYDADKSLGKIYDFIANYDEPTIIIFYGDHLPFLNTADGGNIYSSLGYFSDKRGCDDYLYDYRLHNTKGLIVGNFDIKSDNIKCLGYDLIMPYVFSKMSINVSPFYKWLNTTRDILPSYNYNVAEDKNGNVRDIGSLRGEAAKIYKLREKMNWYFFVDIRNGEKK